ncbi:4'-phosphopantetheinyl transferase family protein [Candidatus Regiella insecticola]|nr:4'-phosphopantetheinyl transferase superfamily protein [Candidatus Regiella insecticola]
MQATEHAGGVVSANPFISEEYFFELHDRADIRVHMCRFSPEQYEDDLFHRFGIHCPDQISRAVPKRRMEYLAGRYSAKATLQAFPVETSQVIIGANRCPVFPSPLMGSIYHSRNVACCSVSQSDGITALGVDIEHFIAGEQVIDIGDSVINDDESRLLISFTYPYNQLFTAVFSAKESLFKALYPQAGFYFGFDYAALRHLEPDNHIMVFELTKPISKAFPKGKMIFTRYYFMADKVFTLVAV